LIALRSLITTSIAITACVALFVYGHYVGSSIADKRCQEAQMIEFKEQNQAIADAREKEQLLQDKANQAKRETDEKIASLNNRVITLSSELRKRPARPKDGVPETTGINFTGCTAAGLYRDDAEFLVGVSRDAQLTLEAFNQCKAAYDALR
jgi:hypothetical protein